MSLDLCRMCSSDGTTRNRAVAKKHGNNRSSTECRYVMKVARNAWSPSAMQRSLSRMQSASPLASLCKSELCIRKGEGQCLTQCPSPRDLKMSSTVAAIPKASTPGYWGCMACQVELLRFRKPPSIYPPSSKCSIKLPSSNDTRDRMVTESRGPITTEKRPFRGIFESWLGARRSP